MNEGHKTNALLVAIIVILLAGFGFLIPLLGVLAAVIGVVWVVWVLSRALKTVAKPFQIAADAIDAVIDRLVARPYAWIKDRGYLSAVVSAAFAGWSVYEFAIGESETALGLGVLAAVFLSFFLVGVVDSYRAARRWQR